MRSSTTLLRFIALLVLCFTLASAAAEEGAGVEEDGQHVFRSRDNSRARAHNEPRRCKKMQRDTHDSGRRDGTDSHNFAISPQVLVQDDGPTPKVKNLAAAAASPSASPSAGAGGGAGAAGAAGNVSASCQQAIGQALSSDLAMCMGFDVLTSDPELAPLLNPTTAGSNQSLIGPLGKYLSQTLCTRTPCSMTTLMQSRAGLSQACNDKDTSDPNSVAGILSRFLSSYNIQRDMACLVNTTNPANSAMGSSSNATNATIQGYPLCSIQLLSGIQEQTNTPISLVSFIGLQSNDPSFWVPVEKTLSKNKTAEQSLLCTDCHKAMSTQLFFNQYPNETILNLPKTGDDVKKTLTNVCGKGYLDGMISNAVKQGGTGAGFVNLNKMTNGSDMLGSNVSASGNVTKSKPGGNAAGAGAQVGAYVVGLVAATVFGATLLM